MLAALNSQNKVTAPSQLPNMNGASGNALFMSPQDAELENFEGDYTPDLDFLDGEANFDFDNADLGGDMIGSLPGSGEYGTEQHEKRKNPDGDDFDDGDVKRQETQKGERGAKKPGRKPLTSEPTTVCVALLMVTICDSADSRHRNAKRRIVLRSARSGSGRKRISRIWRPK